MGLAIEREHFEAADYERFTAKLHDDLAALRTLLARPGFGETSEARTIGAELEVSIVDAEGLALPLERDALPHDLGDQITLELDRFNLEYNLLPLSLRGDPFAALERQLQRAIETLGTIVAPKGRVVPIGILPTLRTQDLEAGVMTDLPRYRALSRALREQADGPFRVHIDGADPLDHHCDDVTLEGAATSFQVHLRVAPHEFAGLYNAIQLTTPLAVALCANSPVFLEHRLWDETRIALFKQAVDARNRGDDWRRPARVSFGHGWNSGGAYELFAEAVALFRPLLPVVGDEDALAVLADGGLPRLDELRMQHGTVWRWNRAIYDPAAGGHLRIEMRALPAGPTPADMAAGAALMIGLAFGLQAEVPQLLPGLPFEHAEWNFYRAAQYGLDAQVLWPHEQAPSPRLVPIRQLAQRLLPRAVEGLERAGVESNAARRWIGIAQARLDADQTGARWQRGVLEARGIERDRHGALRAMLDDYLGGLASGRPVHEWALP